MKACAGCAHEYEESFKFCPECGRPFGGAEVEDLKRKMDQHLLDMKRQAGVENNLSRRVFSGSGLGNTSVGPVFGAGNEWN